MANRPNNIWAKAAAGSPGTNIARAQQSRWTGIPNEAIMRLVEDKIGGMLEGISDATERSAAAQMQLDLQKKLQAAAALNTHDAQIQAADTDFQAAQQELLRPAAAAAEQTAWRGVNAPLGGGAQRSKSKGG